PPTDTALRRLALIRQTFLANETGRRMPTEPPTKNCRHESRARAPSPPASLPFTPVRLRKSFKPAPFRLNDGRSPRSPAGFLLPAVGCRGGTIRYYGNQTWNGKRTARFFPDRGFSPPAGAGHCACQLEIAACRYFTSASAPASVSSFLIFSASPFETP